MRVVSPPCKTMPRRWHVIFACVLSALSTGFCYSFGIYSGAIKQQFSLRQWQITTIGTIGSLMFPFSALCGHITDIRGPRVSMMAGGILMAFGLCAEYMVASKRLGWSWAESGTGATILLCVSVLVVSAGGNWTASMAYSTPVRTFPSDRGSVVGLVKAWAGIGGGLMTILFVGFFGQPNDSSKTLTFLLLQAAVAFLATNLVAPWFLPGGTNASWEITPTNQLQRQQNYAKFYGKVTLAYIMVAVLILTVAIGSVLTHRILPARSPGATAFASAAVAICCVNAAVLLSRDWASRCGASCFLRPLGAAAMANSPIGDLRAAIPGGCHNLEEQRSSSQDTGRQSWLLGHPDQSFASDSAASDSSVSSIMFPDFTLLGMVRTLDCPLLLWSSACIIGSGYCLTTNAFQIVESARAGASAASAVALFSASQSFGRLVGGMGPDLLMSRAFSFATSQMPASPRGVRTGPALLLTRPMWLVLACMLSALGHMLLILTPKLEPPSSICLYSGFSLAGLGFGLVWPVMVAVTSERWGVAHLGVNYMFYDGLTACFGALLLGNFIPQKVYEDNTASGTNTCLGSACFAATHLTVIALCVSGIGTAIWLSHRTMSLYKAICIAKSNSSSSSNGAAVS